MSCHVTYPRRVSQRISNRKVRKPNTDDSDKITKDHGVDFFTTPDSSHLSVEGYNDLFGEFIPSPKCSSEPLPKTKAKSVNRTTVSKKKKRPFNEPLMNDPIRLNQSSSDIPIVSKDSLNVSGILSLPNSPTSSSTKKSDINSINYENNKMSSIFEGVVGFVDYKIGYDRNDVQMIIQMLLEMGAKVEKTFNLKVTHVVFCDGYCKTYIKSIERNIPLVSARWIEDSKLANKILDTKDYPPVGIEKYWTQALTVKIPKHINYKSLRPSAIEGGRILRSRCQNLMEHVKNVGLSVDDYVGNNKKISGTKDFQKTESLEKPDENNQTKDPISVLSDYLPNISNTNNSPILDEKMNVPLSINVMRKYHLTPQGKENKSSTELDSDLLKIEEDPLKIKSSKLIFPWDKKLINMNNVSEFPSPSPHKLKINSPTKSISTKKKKVLDEEIIPQLKSLNGNEKNVTNEILECLLPSDLDPIKIKKKIDIKNKKNLKITQNIIPKMISESSFIMIQSPKTSVVSPLQFKSMACAGLINSKVDKIKLCIQNLGTYIFHYEVESSTTYVVTSSQPNRTINIVFAMAFGCFIVSEEWVFESQKVGRWLPHQEYLIQNLPKPVQDFQIQRQKFGSFLTFHIFDDAGIIYIADTCEVSTKDLTQLVCSCGGQCTSIETEADVVVGYTSHMNNNIHEEWILDCICQGRLLNTCHYRLVDNNMM